MDFMKGNFHFVLSSPIAPIANKHNESGSSVFINVIVNGVFCDMRRLRLWKILLKVTNLLMVALDSLL